MENWQTDSYKSILGKGKNDISLTMNSAAFQKWYHLLYIDLISRFEWKNLPKEIPPYFIEKVLATYGYCAFSYINDDIGFAATLTTLAGDGINNYFLPKSIETYSVQPGSEWHRKLELGKDGVLIFDSPDWSIVPAPAKIIEMAAYRLALYERTIDVNLSAQKTPVILQVADSQRLSVENLYKKINANEPVVVVDNKVDMGAVLKTADLKAPYVVDKLLNARQTEFDTILTMFGIENSNMSKKERLVESETEGNNGQIMMSREAGLQMRRWACDQINEIWGLNVECDFRGANDSTGTQILAPETLVALAGADAPADTEQQKESEDNNGMV